MDDTHVYSQNPITGQTIARVPRTAPEAVIDALNTARRAAHGWAAVPIPERAQLLRRVLTDIQARSDELAASIAAETGQCEAAVRFNQLFETAGLFRWYTGAFVRHLRPRPLRISSIDFPGSRGWVEREPLGVVGIITPWNYPWSLPWRSLLPALMAGNAVLFKPSEHTPLTGQAIAELLAAHLPDGVVQPLHGGGDVGAALAAADVDAVFFTGSVRAGRTVAAACGHRMVPAHLELGGKDAALVLADCDLDRTALAVTWGALFNSGQDCSSVERVYVEGPLFEPFCEHLARAVRRVRAWSEGARVWDIGPLITEEQDALVRAHLAEARQGGAELIAGSWPHPSNPVIGPVALRSVPADARVLTEETFGPVIPVVKVPDAEEGLRLANASKYALQFSVWTSDLDRGRSLCRRARAGVRKINATSWVATVPGSVWGGPGATGGGGLGGPDMAARMSRSVTRVDVQSRGYAANWLPMDDDAAAIARARLALDEPSLAARARALSGLTRSLGRRLKALRLPADPGPEGGP
jgi:acyl-CoA reductase-like NAD-dependent aldehyde dehydrogenase